MEKSASKKRTKTSSTAAESPIKSKGDTDKQIKKKTKKNDDEDDMEVMIEAVRTASNPNKKNKRALTEWEKSFNSLAKPKTNFCDNCGCLLPLTADSQINCKMCGFNVNADELEEHVIVTKAKPKSSIRQKGKKEEDKSNDRAIIDEKCLKCGHGKMYFYTMQLRSVDEGSTVFYECVKCAYKFSQNN